MLTDQRRAPRDAPRRAVEKIRRARVAKFAVELGMLDLDEVAALDELLVVEQRFGRAHGRVRLAQQLRALEQFVARIIFDPIVEHFEHMLGHQVAIHRLLVVRVVEVGPLAVGLDPFDERGPVAERAMHDVPVAAFADPKETAPVQSAAAWLGLVAFEVSAGDVLDGRSGGLLHAEIDPLPVGGAIARKQREHHGNCAEVRRRMIGLEAERTHRRVIRKAVDVEHAAERAQHGVVGDEIAIRPGLAERRNRAEHDRGILATENVPAEPELIHRAGGEALDYDIGGTCELQKNVGAARMIEIERQRALVEIVEPEKQAAIVMRQIVEERADAPSVVARGRFDLDYVGAHVAQQPRAKLCAMTRKVEDAQAGERARAEFGHGLSAGFGVTGASSSLSSSLTLGGGRSSIANALVSSVGGISISTSFFGPVRLPPTTRIVSNVSGLTHRTPITAGFA